MDGTGDKRRSHSQSPYMLNDTHGPEKRKESPISETSSERKRSKISHPVASPMNSGKGSKPRMQGALSPAEGNSRQAAQKLDKPSSNKSSPRDEAGTRGSSRSPLEKERRRHKHRRRDGDSERRGNRDNSDLDSPSRKRRREKTDFAAREAGEIPDSRPRDYRDSNPRQRPHDRHRSHSRPRAPGTDGPRPRIDNNVDRSARQNPGNQAPRSLASTRLAGIPEDLRQAALAVQKKRQEEAAALREAEAGAAAAGVIEAELASGANKPSKHSPIVWGSASQASPSKKAKMLTASERAQEELAAFQGLQTLGIDADAPAALKASPSGSGSENGDLKRQSMDADVEPSIGGAIKSRWLIDEEEDLPAINGQANGEEARLAALNKEEQQDLEITREMEDHGNEWEDDEEISDFQRTRPPVNMLNGSRRVEDCFERLNRISEGTYGVVHRARDKQTNTICALKKIKMDKERDGFPLTSIREINILLCFHHKNIVDVSEVAVGAGLDDIFMVMEFMEHDLRDLMEDMSEPFTVAETKNLMRQLLEGMAYLHGNWVLHRDLKTSNILYNNKGQLKICDFGLARQYGSPLRPYTSMVVTLYYRAIELLLGTKEYSTAIDIWSLGCIMAELLTKKVLFQGTGEIDQIDKIFKILGSPTEKIWPGYKELEGVKKLNLREQRRTLREVLPAASRFDPNSGLTEAGFDLIERMLAMDPKQRISAEKALDHEWFKEQPKAKENYLMPTYPTSKDGSNRNARQKLARRAASPPREGPNFGRVADSFSTLFGKKK